MRLSEKINSTYTDKRIRQDILPVRVVATFGDVKNAEYLLKEKLPQVTLKESSCVTLSNAHEETAAIILDFGREINGGLRILGFSATNGCAEVHITFGESVSETMSDVGEKGATNDHTLRDFNTSIMSYSDQTFGETGFRFAKIKLLGKNVSLSLKSIMAVFVYNDIEYKGSFECNDPILNDIYNTCAYTCHLCMQRYLWDGIKRDRLVWVGDMHPEMLTVKTVFGDSDIMTDTINFARKTTPSPEFMNGYPTYSIWWLCILWDWYFYTGNKEFLNQNKEYALGLIRQILNYISSNGSDTFDYKFLDWPTSTNEAGAQGVKGLLGLGLKAASKLSGELGDKAVQKECNQKLEAMGKRKYSFFGAKQTAAVLALADFTDTEKAAEFILEGGAKGMSTFMSYYILTVAAKNSVAGALDMLKEYYGGMLNMGATTFWEDFDISWLDNAAPINEIVPEGKSDIHADFGAFCYKGLRHSLCHGWSSGPTAFLAEKVLGISVTKAGCKEITISPDLGGLSWARGTFPTPLGTVSVSHHRLENGNIETTVDAPKGIVIIKKG